jgi:hypothetical protein
MRLDIEDENRTRAPLAGITSNGELVVTRVPAGAMRQP